MATNEQLADAFGAARDCLWNGRKADYYHPYTHAHICNALEQAYNDGYISYSVLVDAKYIVMERLEGLNDLADWLAHKGVPYEQQTDRKLQKHRRKWLKKLVKEFSK